MTARCLTAVRLSENGRAVVRERADTEAEGNVSEMVRRMLKYASIHMPKGWK